MQLSAYGTDAIGAAITQNIDQVGYLRGLIEREPCLEQVGPSEMNVVCFRYVVPELPDDALNEFNVELLVRIQESGVAVPSNAYINGTFALRVAHVNHRSTSDDFDLLVQAVSKLGSEVPRGP